VCPKCGKRRLQRLIGAGAGVIFKGSGFYQTDYRSDSYKKAEKKEKDSAETKAGQKDTKTEAKDKNTKKQTKPQATDGK
jgi:predicted nucleic acid-binding Zn ribbon protein